MTHKTKFGMEVEAQVIARPSVEAGLKFHNTYKVECFDSEGNLKWVEEVVNITVNEGLNDNLSQYFKGSSYTAGFFVGLIDNAGFSALAAGDTAAQIGGSNGWAELTAYSQSTRPALVLGSVSGGSVSNSGSVAVFSINATKTVNGAFVVTNSTKAGTSGKIFGEASFGATRSVANGDTLNVTVTLTAASA